MSPGPGRWLATALQRTEWMIRAIALAALALWSLVAYGGGSPRLVLAPSPDRDLTARATLRALTPDARYDYRIHADGSVAVTGHFRTAPPSDRAVPLRVLWSADLGARGYWRRTDAGYAIFDAMAARRPDRFLFLGDTVYADHRCRGDDTVPGADFVWDDHDVRSNFAGPDERLMPVGRQAFLDYWPVEIPPGDPTRLYRRFRHGRLADIFVLDTRQYRTGNCRRDGPDKTLLGARQRRWLIDGLATSTADWKLVASSVPLSIPKAWPCGDSWASRDLLVLSTGFARERDEILRELRDRAVANVVFLAGDVHFALLAAHEPWPGFRFHELMAGPLAAGPKRARSPDGTLGSRVLFSAGGMATFGELDLDADGLTARLFDGAGSLLATERLPRRAVGSPRR